MEGVSVHTTTTCQQARLGVVVVVVTTDYYACVSCLFFHDDISSTDRCRQCSLARWPIPYFDTMDVFWNVVQDAAKSVLSLFEELQWIKADPGAAPPLAIMTPTVTRKEANMAIVKEFVVQSGFGMEGFDQGGVSPFWSGNVMSLQSLQYTSTDNLRRVLEADPRALLVNGDPGSTSFFMSGLKKYFVGAVDKWSPEEPSSS